MNIISSEQDIFEMQLKQLGAKVQSIHGLLCYVRFRVNETDILYIYNINAKKQYFLQRVIPYPIGAGVFETPKEIIKFIKDDIKKFQIAKNSRSFEKFIDINYKVHRTVHDLDDLFLKYNVPESQMEKIEGMLSDIEKIIDETKGYAPKIELD